MRRIFTLFTCDRCQKEEKRESDADAPEFDSAWPEGWSFFWPPAISPVNCYPHLMSDITQTICGDCLTDPEREAVTAQRTRIDEIPF